MRCFKAHLQAIFAIIAIATLVSCGDSNDFNMEEDSYFIRNLADIEITAEVNSFSLSIGRHKGNSSVSVPVRLTESSGGVFSTSPTVDFQENRRSADLIIGYDKKEIEPGRRYSISLCIGNAEPVTVNVSVRENSAKRDYSLSLRFVETESGTDKQLYARFELTPGKDVAFARVAVSKNDTPANLISKVLSETHPFNLVSVAGMPVFVDIPLTDSPGQYVAVATAHASDNQECHGSCYTTFEVIEPADNWTAVGTATVTDPWIIPAFFAETTFSAAIERHSSGQMIFRLRNMYGYSPAGHLVSGTGNDIIIDCTDPDFVTVAPQSAGITGLYKEGVPMIANANYVNSVLRGVAPEEIKKLFPDDCVLRGNEIIFAEGSALISFNGTEFHAESKTGSNGNKEFFKGKITLPPNAFGK